MFHHSIDIPTIEDVVGQIVVEHREDRPRFSGFGVSCQNLRHTAFGKGLEHLFDASCSEGVVQPVSDAARELTEVVLDECCLARAGKRIADPRTGNRERCLVANRPSGVTPAEANCISSTPPPTSPPASPPHCIPCP